MKCFKGLVMARINSSLPTCFDPRQFTYRHNRSTADATSLEHLDNKDTYIGLLLVNYSSTFSTIIVGPKGLKTEEMIIDFRKKGGERAPIYINRTEVDRVKSIKLLGETITNNLSWASHIDVMVKKAQQHLFFLRRLRKFGMSIRTLTSFNRGTIESTLSGYITAWQKRVQKPEHMHQQVQEQLLSGRYQT
eukprot:g40203.t1